MGYRLFYERSPNTACNKSGFMDDVVAKGKRGRFVDPTA